MNYRTILNDEFINQKKSIENAETIILYGNSIVACIMKIAIKELGFDTKILVFDKGKFISKQSETINLCKSVIFFCSSRLLTRLDMMKQSEKLFPDAKEYDFYALYYAWITKVVQRKCDYDAFAETLYLCREDKCLFNIDSINTFFCNLRCKECSNGIPYRKEKKKISADSQVYHLDKLTEKLPISQCNFQGGEVFLDVDFAEFVLKHSHNARIGIFTVATNGTMLPSDDTFRVLKETGCMIRISDYGTISRQKNAIIDKCNEYQIPCFTFPMAEEWKRFGEYRRRNRQEKELKQISKGCCFGTHDMMFVNNKIYCCLRTLYADAIGDNSEAMQANTLDLDSDFSLEELMDFIQGKELWKMCDYCDFPMETIEPAEQF